MRVTRCLLTGIARCRLFIPCQITYTELHSTCPTGQKTVKNLKNELFPILKKVNNDITAPYTKRPNDLKCEQNVSRLIQDAGVLPEVQDRNRGLVNYFTRKEANPAQQNDLLNFRCIGQQEFLQRVSSVILRNPSVHAPNRKRRLQTFTDRKITKSRVAQSEKD